MGSFILCHEKKANQPYFLDDIHLNIFSIEELCFYLCSNLYLLDKNILDKELCAWIDAELEMPQLAADLLKSVESGLLNRFVMTILAYVGFCDEAELDEIQHTLTALKDQTIEEQRKKRADNLLKNGKYDQAIIEYDKILKSEGSGRLSKDFFGKVRHNKGSAYAKQFLFKEASDEFILAYNQIGLKDVLTEYLCACYMYMSREEFSELLEETPELIPYAEKMQEEFVNQERQYRFYQGQRAILQSDTRKRIEEIKEDYRKSLN